MPTLVECGPTLSPLDASSPTRPLTAAPPPPRRLARAWRPGRQQGPPGVIFTEAHEHTSPSPGARALHPAKPTLLHARHCLSVIRHRCRRATGLHCRFVFAPASTALVSTPTPSPARALSGWPSGGGHGASPGLETKRGGRGGVGRGWAGQGRRGMSTVRSPERLLPQAPRHPAFTALPSSVRSQLPPNKG
jgi:hypothetical protein